MISCNNSLNIFVVSLVSGMTSDIQSSNIDQQKIMTFAYIFSVTILVLFSILSNILSIETFHQSQIRSTTVGFYLIVYSCCSIFGMLMLEIRLIRLLSSFSSSISFIFCNIIAVLSLIFNRICLWMSGLIAIQRSLYSFQSNILLNKIRARTAAPKQILIIIVSVFLMHIHESICRVSVVDLLFQGNFICQIKYSPSILILNTVFSFTHIFVPFSLNMLANCLILIKISRRKAILHHTSYWVQCLRHFRHHRHLFLAPTLVMICTLPQLTLSLSFSCVDISLKWLLRFNTAANLIIYLPQAATFLVFILPSKAYFHVFKTQSYLGKHFFSCGRSNNKVVPFVTIIDQRKIRNNHLMEIVAFHQIQRK